MAFVLNTTVTNLGETDIVVPDTANYQVKCKLQLPNAIVPTATQGSGGGAGTGSGGGAAVASQVVTLIKLNSSTKYTSNAGDAGASIAIAATAGDTIKVVTSSSLAQDNQPEAVKVTISIYEY